MYIFYYIGTFTLHMILLCIITYQNASNDAVVVVVVATAAVVIVVVVAVFEIRAGCNINR